MKRAAQAQKPGPPVLSSDSLFQLLKPCFHPLQEEVWLLGLNSQLEVLTCDLVFRGTADACLIHPRDIFRRLFEVNSTRFILSHNHPSGSCEPSKKDLEITRKLYKAGVLLEVPLIDHIILGSKSYFSFADAGLLTGKRALARCPYQCPQA